MFVKRISRKNYYKHPKTRRSLTGTIHWASQTSSPPPPPDQDRSSRGAVRFGGGRSERLPTCQCNACQNSADELHFQRASDIEPRTSESQPCLDENSVTVA
ncbi:hypothetical protein J6590_010856 [Homalodisca vitripennis]|nr:hypothetical protein J6590_010856 [Homalodisca vitripennis]